MVLRLVIGFLASICCAQAAESSSPPAEHFARLPVLRMVDIAPGGKHMLARFEKNGRYIAGVFAIDGDTLRLSYAAQEDDETSISRFRWVNADRIALSAQGTSKRSGTDTVETRLYGLTPGQTNLEPLFRYDEREAEVQFEDDVVSWMDNDLDHILLEYRKTPRTIFPAVMKVPVNKRGLHRTVQPAKQNVYNWRADYAGRIRSGRGYRDDNENKPYLIIRTDDNDQWRDISHRIAPDATDFIIRGFSDRPNIAYVESGHEYDPPALYEYNITEDRFEDMIFRDEAAELGAVMIDQRNGKLRGIGYGEEAENIKWLDPAIEEETAKIHKLFPDKAVSLIRESIDANHAIYEISGLLDPGAFYAFNRNTKSLAFLTTQYPELANHTLASVVKTPFEARDGLSIPAYITLPTKTNALDTLSDAPFIILPHGGPTSRDFLRFDYWSQFYASRGYAVLQINFRGSTGYGQEFRDAGDKEWGQAMQDDITDGVKWLINMGYADKNRIAIMGGSYGGYAALMGGAKTPELYQCIVSIAGVSDLNDLLRRAENYVGGKAGTRHIGRLWKDRKMLAANSPSKLAKNFQAPVLLIHGEDDRVVDVKQSQEMRRALNGANKDVTYIELPKGDHHLSLSANRLRFLKETESFLASCLN